jgi:two-component system response regulator PilR (NtrC family)
LEETPVDVRILSATHKSLEHEVAAGHFRQDLYYRLNVIKLKVPPLRERQEDILLLADFFLKKIAARWQMPPIRLSPAARDELAAYGFPGNVRELENVLERASTLCDNNMIQPDDLQLPVAEMTAHAVTPHPADPSLRLRSGNDAGLEEKKVAKGEAEVLPAWNPVDEEAERDLILRALEQTRWNRTKAAEVLGMSFRQLRYRIQKYGLDEG